jgi:ethanolamine utilization protein EutN
MQIARVVGNATSTVKHPSMPGWRLLVAQSLTISEEPDGQPLLVIDYLGAGLRERVVLSNDGAAARESVESKSSPVRWFVVGLVDR